MTINDNTNVLPTRSTATSSQTIFPYPFKIFESTDLNVYVTPAGQDANDVTDIVMGFSVTGIGDEDGGTITLVVAVSVGDLVTIVSDIPENRTTDYQSNGDFLPVTVNADFDRVVAAGTGTDDGGSFIDLTTHQAKVLFPGGAVNIVQFGAVGDGITDDTVAIQSAANSGLASIYAPEGTYAFSQFVVPGTVREFFGAGGEIHPRVRQMMREVLLDGRKFTYLNATAERLLSDARSTAFQAGLAQQSLITLSQARCLWFTWTGTKVQRTLCLIAASVGLRATDRDVAIEFESGALDVIQRLQQALREPNDAGSLAARLPAKQTRKLDHLIAEPLLVQSLAHDALDIPGAEGVLRAMETAK